MSNSGAVSRFSMYVKHLACSARYPFLSNIFYWTVPFLMHVEHSLKELFTIILPEEVLLNVTLEHKINVINANFSLN